MPRTIESRTDSRWVVRSGSSSGQRTSQISSRGHGSAAPAHQQPQQLPSPSGLPLLRRHDHSVDQHLEPPERGDQHARGDDSASGISRADLGGFEAGGGESPGEPVGQRGRAEPGEVDQHPIGVVGRCQPRARSGGPPAATSARRRCPPLRAARGPRPARSVRAACRACSTACAARSPAVWISPRAQRRPAGRQERGQPSRTGRLGQSLGRASRCGDDVLRQVGESQLRQGRHPDLAVRIGRMETESLLQRRARLFATPAPQVDAEPVRPRRPAVRRVPISPARLSTRSQRSTASSWRPSRTSPSASLPSARPNNDGGTDPLGRGSPGGGDLDRLGEAGVGQEMVAAVDRDPGALDEITGLQRRSGRPGRTPRRPSPDHRSG